jgi:integrase
MPARRDYGSGSIHQRSPNVFVLRVQLPPDPVDGRRRRLVRTFHGTRRQAQDELARMKTAAPDQLDASAVTVDELLDRVMATLTVSERTRDDWSQVIRDYVSPEIGRLELRRLTGERLDRLYADLRRRGVSPYRVLRVHEIVSTACARAVRWRWLERNPAADATRPQRPARKSRAHRDEVVERLSVAAATDPVWGLWFHLAALLGLRRGELAALTWNDVDLDGATLRVHRAVIEAGGRSIVKGTKTADHRLLPLDADTVDMLAARRRRHLEQCLACGVSFDPARFVFAHRGNVLGDRPPRPSAATHWFARLRAEADAGDVRLQDLRHLAGSEMLAAGVDPSTVAYLLGHSVETLLENYAHVLDGRKEAAVQLMADVVRRRRTVR